MSSLDELNRIFNVWGAYFVAAPGIDRCLSTLSQVPLISDDFASNLGPRDNTIWKMTPKNLYVPSQNKMSYFLFDPTNNPGHFGCELTKYIHLIDAATFQGETIRKHQENLGLKIEVGIHYYNYHLSDDTEANGQLDAHNDVGWWSIINSTGPVSLWIGKWVTVSKTFGTTFTLPPDTAILMRGLSAALTEGGSPVLHKVEEIKDKKFTIGIFMALRNEAQELDLGTQKLSLGEFNRRYFEVNDDPEIEFLRSQFVRIDKSK
ncbi:Hypothetical protein POVR1_LOCUS383 [uncultured virus]|nr:Hypothetical protein POVR1_LOCUS383 [uncultured virus]